MTSYLLLVLPAVASALLASHAPLARPVAQRTVQPPRQNRAAVRMLDPSLAADASTALVQSVQTNPGLAVWDGHTLDTLIPDLMHTTVYATVGLLGAYVTQVRCRKILVLQLLRVFAAYILLTARKNKSLSLVCDRVPKATRLRMTTSSASSARSRAAGRRRGGCGRATR